MKIRINVSSKLLGQEHIQKRQLAEDKVVNSKKGDEYKGEHIHRPGSLGEIAGTRHTPSPVEQWNQRRVDDAQMRTWHNIYQKQVCVSLTITKVLKSVQKSDTEGDLLWRDLGNATEDPLGQQYPMVVAVENYRLESDMSGFNIKLKVQYSGLYLVQNFCHGSTGRWHTRDSLLR